jgi:hypothetical protein
MVPVVILFPTAVPRYQKAIVTQLAESSFLLPAVVEYPPVNRPLINYKQERRDSGTTARQRPNLRDAQLGHV